MLSSRYAPVVALATLGIVLVAVLGYFLAIKPQWDATSDLDAQAEDVRANTVLVNTASQKLDEYATLLEGGEEVEQAIALNAPSRLDVYAFRDRLDKAIIDSKLELLTFAQDSTSEVPGWAPEPATLVSSQVAALFQTGPTSTAPAPAEGEEGTSTTGWTPVVTAPTEADADNGTIYTVPFSFTVIGSPDETYDFLKRMRAEDQPIFEISALTQEARNADAAPIVGIGAPEDGDVITTITGTLFVLDPDLTVTDDGELGDVKPPSDSAFIDSPGADEQPGA